MDRGRVGCLKNYIFFILCSPILLFHLVLSFLASCNYSWFVSLHFRARNLARFPTTNSFTTSSISFASSGVDTWPTIIIFYHSSMPILSVLFKRCCCTTIALYLYSCYPKLFFSYFSIILYVLYSLNILSNIH